VDNSALIHNLSTGKRGLSTILSTSTRARIQLK
jgi:hypothetical protein